MHDDSKISSAARANLKKLAGKCRAQIIRSHSTNAVADIGWREFFQDPRLQKLIELSLTNNRDLRVAVLNVEQTRAQYRIQRAALIPTGNLNASGTRQRIAYGFGGQGNGLTYSQYSVELGVSSYEVDLFGRVRSLKRAALENYFAAEEDRKSAQIALVAEVANQYLNERELAEQLKMTHKTLVAVQDSYDLTKASYDAGVASELDLRSAEAQVETAKAALAANEQQRAQAENALVLLVGEPLPADLPPPRPLGAQHLLTDLPPGLPSDLLQRRPDILEAEHQLKAANADIGAARAAFFPTITLTGGGGTSSTALRRFVRARLASVEFFAADQLACFCHGHGDCRIGRRQSGQTHSSRRL